jgi:hypothetical protein
MGSQYPEISRRANGDRLIGFAEPLAEQLYAAGTPPVHGLSDEAGIADWIAEISIGARRLKRPRWSGFGPSRRQMR